MSTVKRVSIDDLTEGSYVVSVTKQVGTLRIRHTGLVRSSKVISQLKENGILELEIDMARSINQEKDDVAEELKEDKPKRKANLDVELTKARAILEETRNIQKSLLNDIQRDNLVDAKPLENVANNLIESVFRNSDAMSCLARIRDKNAHLLEHAISCATLMAVFGKHLDLDKKIINELAVGAMLHDVGKVRLPEEILNKTTRLTPEEVKMDQTHISHTADILSEMKDLSPISREVAINHHELLNGKGYPAGLKGEQISMHTRMMTIVDIYDNLTRQTNKNKESGPLAAFRLMMERAPNELDAELLPKFIKCIGIYPVGTVVRLKSGRLGIVTHHNANHPTRPKIKLVYNAKHQHHIDVKTIDLVHHQQDEIEACVNPEKYGLDMHNYL